MAKKAKKQGWVPGRSRNKTEGWEPVLRRLQSVLNRKWTYGLVSLRAIAAYVGCDKRAVGKWVAGDTVPSPDRMAKVVCWLSDVEAELAKRDSTK